MMGTRAITSLFHVIVKQKPLVDCNESALFLAYLFADRVHADSPSGLLVMSWRGAWLMIMLYTLNLYVGE